MGALVRAPTAAGLRTFGSTREGHRSGRGEDRDIPAPRHAAGQAGVAMGRPGKGPAVAATVPAADGTRVSSAISDDGPESTRRQRLERPP
jgi:hypothetical protein